MPQAPQYKVPALEKGLDILEALAADPIPLSLAELASRLNRSSSELFRMLNCLEHRNYIERDSVSGKYLLSLKLYALSHTHSVIDRLTRSAIGPMQELTDSLRESCHLSLLDRGRLLVVSQVESPSPIRLSIEVGARFDPLLTASGRLLLAHSTEPKQAEHLQQSDTWNQLSPAKQKRVRSELQALSKNSSVEAESDTIEGVIDLSTIIGNSPSGLLAALTVTRFRSKKAPSNKASAAKSLLETASKITDSLGLNPS
ncbi:helix-turn-helix domain-containing protein [Pelagicoccus sp. NFK12]|uniref:Helix-turn-helix domain-containing protein n=1 Tax=Pelagicoccus enzymogenes TaxID=2773457 RepID=A0A927F8S0_9BACT|nr:helix-turn-helix domain-containing protein [Pelagicoccus enzymogenes]MBD5780412.1 helix-turn-helix domain-containing protein [Pelagicoccus enzymogenes]